MTSPGLELAIRRAKLAKDTPRVYPRPNPGGEVGRPEGRSPQASKPSPAATAPFIPQLQWSEPSIVPEFIPCFRRLQLEVAHAFGVSIEDLLSHRGSRAKRGAPVRARMVAMYVARYALGISYPAIAKRFNRDHSTVVHAVRMTEKECTTDMWLLFFTQALIERYRRT